MTQLSTKIARVTAFRDGARVTRIGKKKLSAGPQKITISGITSHAREDSFRVKGKGPAALSTIDVRSIDTIYEPSEDLKPLHDALDVLEKKQIQVSDEIEIYQARLVNLTNMTEQFAGVFGTIFAANEAKISQLTEMDQTATERAEETQEKIRSLEQELEDVQNQLAVVRHNIGRIQSKTRTETNYEVEVSLEVAQDSEIELEITYQCHGAQWSPSYDVDLLQGTAKLRRVAMVRNQTKEDWNKVGLTISTATARPVEAVEGSPFWISIYSPPRPKASRRSRSMKMKKGLAMPSAAPPPAPGGGFGAMPPEPPVMTEEFAEAFESASGISVYELPKPMTIPYDNEKHPVTLTEEDLDSKTIHYWYPDGMAEVVAQDEVTNGDSVILPGSMKVYAEGDYIGETNIEQISPREEFKLGTRTAYDVKAQKHLVEKDIEKAGITRGKRRRYYKYRLEIESFSKRPLEIEIVDRVPHSNSTAIEVKLDVEKLGVLKIELGVLKWTKNIDAGQKVEIIYDYEVLWERDVTISPPLP
ncbi:MAG: mucoidy inhibitor MuiA family protein [Candidatus Thorarchaeota archaeon]|nr:mucoidy inhibitor MuiA family protein [Candidatus Thorarchaeota archaeon]MCK5238469.1 mucoidy inhibitor MuiA family protein [Candidatus Thorarchaeota archaeon]